jgi:hypothetical protein
MDSRRALNVLSCLHPIFSSPPLSLPTLDCRQATALTWSTTLLLLACRPYEVTVRDAVNQEVLVDADGEYVVGEEVGRVLAGAVVELVECDDEGTMTIGLPSSSPS